MMSKRQAQALSAFIESMRPTWDAPGVMAQLSKVARMNEWDTAMAALRAAANPKVKSPGVIPVLNGPHWRERVSEPGAPSHPTRDEACRTCGGWRDACPCRATDGREAVYDDDTADTAPFRDAKAAAFAAARQARSTTIATELVDQILPTRSQTATEETE